MTLTHAIRHHAATLIHAIRHHAATAVLASLIGFGIIYFAVTQARAPDASRKVVCIGVLHNPANPARNDPLLAELCAEVGVFPVAGAA